jgi:hypothetical protein
MARKMSTKRTKMTAMNTVAWLNMARKMSTKRTKMTAMTTVAYRYSAILIINGVDTHEISSLVVTLVRSKPLCVFGSASL